MLAEKRDACYYKVKRRYKVWPSAYASGALVQCRKKGAKNWGSKKISEGYQDQQTLDESLFQQRVHKNPSVATLKSLARNNRFHSCRFVIYNDGTVVAGDSAKFTHHSMAPAMGAWTVKGYVDYMGNDDYAYRSMEPYSALNKYHPVLKNWVRAGIEDGNSDQSHLSQNLDEKQSDWEIYNYHKLDTILVKLCELVVQGQQQNLDTRGMVAAAILDPKNRVVSSTGRKINGKWHHAERCAMMKYQQLHGDIPNGSICITTCSPCSERMGDRYLESCTDLINHSNIHKVYAGYDDPTQPEEQRNFNIIETSNPAIRGFCHRLAETFMDWEVQQAASALSEAPAPGTQFVTLNAQQLREALTYPNQLKENSLIQPYKMYAGIDDLQKPFVMNEIFRNLTPYTDIDWEKDEVYINRADGLKTNAFIGSFEIDSKTVKIYFEKDWNHTYAKNLGIVTDKDGYEFGFRVNGKISITGEGNASVLLKNVIKRAKGFVSTHPCEYIFFSARRDEPSRVKLYDALATMISKDSDLTLSTKNIGYSKYYVLQKVDHDDDVVAEAGGSGLVVPGVNMPAGIHPDEIRRQAKKFGNKVSKNGVPPIARTDGKDALKEDDENDPIVEKWSKKYKKSIDRSNTEADLNRTRLLKLLPARHQQSLDENFADGKGPGRPGDSARHGIPKHATLAQLDKIGQGSGRKAQLARWQANMRRGKKK